MPVRVDGNDIEMHECQYWLHSVFAGGAWVSGHLRPGGSDAGGGWREPLEADVAPLLRAGLKVWLRADSACYRGDLARYCCERGWDDSVSVTDARKRKPAPDKLEAMDPRDDEWEPLDEDGAESATVAFHRPSGWDREEACVAVRRTRDGDRLPMEPRYAMIPVGDDRLPVKEAVRRHRGKQERENAFKGPLTDLNLHRPPCKSYKANQAFYACGQIAQLLLLTLQRAMLSAAAPAGRGAPAGPSWARPSVSGARSFPRQWNVRLRLARPVQRRAEGPRELGPCPQSPALERAALLSFGAPPAGQRTWLYLPGTGRTPNTLSASAMAREAPHVQR